MKKIGNNMAVTLLLLCMLGCNLISPNGTAATPTDNRQNGASTEFSKNCWVGNYSIKYGNDYFYCIDNIIYKYSNKTNKSSVYLKTNVTISQLFFDPEGTLYYLGADEKGINALYKHNSDEALLHGLLCVLCVNNLYIYYLEDDGYLYEYNYKDGEIKKLADIDNDYITPINLDIANVCYYQKEGDPNIYLYDLKSNRINSIFNEYQNPIILANDDSKALVVNDNNIIEYDLLNNHKNRYGMPDTGFPQDGYGMIYEDKIYLANNAYESGNVYMYTYDVGNQHINKTLICQHTENGIISTTYYKNGLWYLFIDNGNRKSEILEFNANSNWNRKIASISPLDSEEYVFMEIAFDKLWVYKYRSESGCTFYKSYSLSNR